MAANSADGGGERTLGRIEHRAIGEGASDIDTDDVIHKGTFPDSVGTVQTAGSRIVSADLRLRGIRLPETRARALRLRGDGAALTVCGAGRASARRAAR